MLLISSITPRFSGGRSVNVPKKTASTSCNTVPPGKPMDSGLEAMRNLLHVAKGMRLGKKSKQVAEELHLPKTTVHKTMDYLRDALASMRQFQQQLQEPVSPFYKMPQNINLATFSADQLILADLKSKGYKNKAIAKVIKKSPRTVEKRLTELRQVTDSRTTAEMVANITRQNQGIYLGK